MLRKKIITDISRQSSADSSSAVVLHSPSKQGKSRKQGKHVPIFTAFVALIIISIFAVSTMKLDRQDVPMDKEHSTTFLMKSSLRKEKENTSIQKPPGVVTKQLLQTSDSCRNERTNTITLSLSEFCLNGGQSENDLLRNQFNWIERNLAPYANELFQEEDKQQDELTVVVMPNALCRQNERVNRRDITLTTQMSINKLTPLVAIAGRWNGPVSVALRVTSMEELHLLKDQLLKYGEHLDQVAFHLYFEGKSRSYPNNILRNVALDNIWSDYFAVFDVDLLPSPANTHQHLQSALNRHPQLEEKLNNKTVFVLPAWEIDDIIPDENITIHHALYPESKEMLLDRHAKNEEDRNVRIFRSEVYKPGHRTTDYPTWMSNSTDVSYPVVTKEYGYEPYIIGAKKGIPHFFPQFRGYGFNKISFYTELHYASYKLEVLRDFFIFHVNHKSSYSQNQISFHDVNRKCVAKFWSYLSKKYDAGYLKKEQEVVGFKVWNTRMREGLGYDDVFSDSEEEEEEEEDKEEVQTFGEAEEEVHFSDSEEEEEEDEDEEEVQTSFGEVQDKGDESFAACILIMDDNHRLIEWLAYHYHTMPLRRVIVMIDPRSKTSPLPVLNRWEKYMKMDLWSDNDLFTVEELKDRADKEMIKNHRSRQRAFNVKCLTTLKEEGAKWTLMTDVDEYTRINPRALDSSEGIYQTDIAPMQLSEPGSILKMLNKGVDLNDERLHAQEWKACIPVSRVQLSGIESSDEEVNNKFPKELEPTILAKDFDTFRWRYSGVDTITAKDGVLPGKTFIDVSSIPDSEMWRLIGDPHRPIDKLCKGGNVWLNTNETMFVADHILGTLESYSLRDDSRFFDRVLTWQQRKEVGGLTDLHDELRPWLSGFIDTMGIGESRRLLANVGQLQAQTHALPRCSINFFGLPRSFKSMALPSIVKNILLPNARYNCDIVVHYYNMQFDEAGRFNRGGEIDADAVQALKEVSKVIAANAGKSPPSVIIKSETKEEFEEKYGDLVKKYKTAKDVDTGKPKYFPWKEASYSVKTNIIDNVAMQWNSIQSAWQLMEEHSKVHGFEYERVAFFRTDSFYALPVDIFQVDKDTFDYNNRYAVIPAFARYPVNDRMMYGPYEAVKIWATERFQRIDHYIESSEIKGYGMHQERYIANGILPAIREETGYEVVENIDICFYRTRAADSVIITDCSDPIGGSARGIQEIDQVQLVQNLVRRDCLEFPTGDRFIELRCSAEEGKEEEDKEEVQAEGEAQDEGEVREKHDEEEAQGKEDDEDEEEEQEKQEKRGEVEGNLVVSKIK